MPGASSQRPVQGVLRRVPCGIPLGSDLQGLSFTSIGEIKMSVFTALAFVVASQWPGSWTAQEAADAAQVVHQETSAEQLYVIQPVGDWTCIGIENSADENISGSPVCTRSEVDQDFLIGLIEDSLLEVLEAQGRLVE